MLDWIQQRIKEIRNACYVFWPDGQSMGFEDTDSARQVGIQLFHGGIPGHEPEKITSDPKGENVLFEWRVEDREWSCGCKYHYAGWYDVKAGFIRPPIDSIIYEVGKQDDHFHDMMHKSGEQLSSGYMPGGFSFTFASALPPKEDNGDPLS